MFTDLGNLERGGNFNFPDVDSLCIDHHRSNERYTDYLYLQYKYAATAEMLAEMFFDAGISMDEDTCNALYMAIGTDSGFFKFSCTSAHTLLMASQLVAMEPNRLHCQPAGRKDGGSHEMLPAGGRHGALLP